MKTVSRVYDTYGQARQVVADLEAAGVPPRDVNLSPTSTSATSTPTSTNVRRRPPGAGIGGALGGAAGLLAGLGLLAIPGLGPVVAAGWLAALAVGAAAGAAAGGLVGALVSAGVPESTPTSTARRCAAAAPW